MLLREQFGAPLATLQGVQFQLTDAEVERTGVEVLAKYALWSIQAGNAEALDDALALRLAAVEAAETVFRVAHQLHGASGFCDETTLSWLSRYSLPLRRLPWGPSGTLDALTRRIGRRGLTGSVRRLSREGDADELRTSRRTDRDLRRPDPHRRTSTVPTNSTPSTRLCTGHWRTSGGNWRPTPTPRS